MPGFEVYPTADRDLLSDPGPDILTESFFRSSGAYIMEGRVFRIAAAPRISGKGEREVKISRSSVDPGKGPERNSIKGMRRGFLPLNTSSLQLWKSHLAFLGKVAFKNHSITLDSTSSSFHTYTFFYHSFPGQGT